MFVPLPSAKLTPKYSYLILCHVLCASVTTLTHSYSVFACLLRRAANPPSLIVLRTLATLRASQFLIYLHYVRYGIARVYKACPKRATLKHRLIPLVPRSPSPHFT